MKEGSQRCCCFVCQVVRLAAVLIGWTSAQLKETYCVWSPGCDWRRELGRQEGASSEQDRLCAYHPNSIAHELPWEHHYYFLWVCWVRVLSPRRHGRLVFLCEDRCSLESSSFKWTFNRKKKKRFIHVLFMGSKWLLLYVGNSRLTSVSRLLRFWIGTNGHCLPC